MRPQSKENAPFFKSVTPLSGYRVQVETGAGNLVIFDFTAHLHTTRFADLKNQALFRGVKTDGGSLIFRAAGQLPVKITDGEFLELLSQDRPRPEPDSAWSREVKG